MAKKPVRKPVKKAVKKSAGKISKPASKPASKSSAKKSLAKTPAKSAAKPVKSATSLAKSPAKAPVTKSLSKSSASSAASFVKAAAPKSSAKSDLKFTPLDDRILIERMLAPEKTAGGLYIPDSAQEKPTVGKVVAVGRGHRDAKGRTRPCDVKIGDSVLFSAWSGSEIEVSGVKYVLLRETDLLGVTTA